MKKINIKQVDAFTTIPFGGNPAGVVTDASNISDSEKQNIAKEMNLSETAFVSHSGIADFKVQFFTPRIEVDLCGHATIATFSALYEEERLDLSKTIFTQETKAGVLPVEMIKINDKAVFMLSQPLPKFEHIDIDSKDIAKLMGVSEADLIEIQPMKVSTGIWWLVIGVKSLEKLINLKPDLKAIEEISEKHRIIGITPFCLETIDNSCSYHMRAIAPFAGIAEDPVCGTGNGSVASYIIQNQLIKCEDKIDLIGEEGQEVGRPGSVYVSISRKANSISEIKVGGNAVTVFEGKMML